MQNTLLNTISGLEKECYEQMYFPGISCRDKDESNSSKSRSVFAKATTFFLRLGYLKRNFEKPSVNML